MSEDTFKGWAVVELLGHRKLAGLVSEQVVAGKALLRLDVYTENQPVVTQFYNPDSLYCLTPADEALCRKLSERYRPAPVHRYELPAPREERYDDE